MVLRVRFYDVDKKAVITLKVCGRLSLPINGLDSSAWCCACASMASTRRRLSRSGWLHVLGDICMIV